ncbi:MAG: alpha-amylase family glycosyl hydrolase [Pirellulaceae bacterium]
MPLSDDLQSRLLAGLTQLYAERAPQCLERIATLADHYPALPVVERQSLWNEQDVILITYGDQLSAPGCTPLAVLRRFLLQHRLHELFRTLHILPFFPYTSDDGFSVTDYRAVDPALGSWQDIHALGRSFDLMFDLVLNHCSAQHPWFRAYQAGEQPYCDYFVDVDPREDYAAVTRPRTTPLLTAFQTIKGERHLWTTFSDDQVDLNWANPQVFVEMLDTLLFYAHQGARIIRLDAVAYLWKTLGTCCIHLPQAHTVVKLMRMLLEALAPGTLLLTETNVPHRENVSYFGEGDEAHLVYQFSLPPLLLDAFITGDAQPLINWLTQLEPARPNTTFLNFTASHDGIGLRPLENLVSPERLDHLVNTVRAAGGRVSMRHTDDGGDRPYELNASYLSAVGAGPDLTSAAQVRRFLATQAIMLTLRGLPAVYFHSLVGTPNDVEGVARTGRARTINRRKFSEEALQALLTRGGSLERQVLETYCRMLAVRIRQPAFHPDAAQRVVDLDHREVVAFERVSLDGAQRILVVANVAHSQVVVRLPPAYEQGRVSELFGSATAWETHVRLALAPAGLAWLAALG